MRTWTMQIALALALAGATTSYAAPDAQPTAALAEPQTVAKVDAQTVDAPSARELQEEIAVLKRDLGVLESELSNTLRFAAEPEKNPLGAW